MGLSIDVVVAVCVCEDEIGATFSLFVTSSLLFFSNIGNSDKSVPVASRAQLIYKTGRDKHPHAYTLQEEWSLFTVVQFHFQKLDKLPLKWEFKFLLIESRWII